MRETQRERERYEGGWLGDVVLISQLVSGQLTRVSLCLLFVRLLP